MRGWKFQPSVKQVKKADAPDTTTRNRE